MKKIMLFFVSLCLIGCASGGKIVTSDEFHQVNISMSVDELIKIMGKPYSITKLEGGYLEYKYIERQTAADRVLVERHYLFVIKDNKVTSKKQVDLNRPSYERDSYEMQTSTNQKQELSE
ncbi:MAG: hypothetical protein A2888_01275 [Chlamydiae bacterium RIFCSPLOWO2_01_FULL_28_7]|nr:MAG: hypothetical protein A2888_01275 [Chlamydiae bacterium RIFCSPLOWO2_01_FULL_28_7]